MTLRSLLFLCFLIATLPAFTQRKTATVSGKVVDENENPLPNVFVTILGQQKAIATSDSGTFHLQVAADKPFALVFTHSGFKQVQQNFLLNAGEHEKVSIRMENSSTLQEVIIKDERQRSEVGLIKPNPKSVINLPSPVMGVEGLLKVYVGSNNELTSQYNVRGGSYDENLIYVNDFEIFRPYLVRSGQQEGLSFINPALVKNINFYTGGFSTRFGDKMSSVLDIQYNNPKRSGGSAYISLLEQGAHVEGITTDQKMSYVVGIRNRSNRNLLSRQEVQGVYSPNSADLQALVSYALSEKWSTELLTNISTTRFRLIPKSSQLTSSVFSPFFTANLGVDIYFEGQERDEYSTGFVGLASSYQPHSSLKLKWLAARFENDEKENIDIAGAYLFGDRDFDIKNATYGLIVNPLGAGVFQNFARNQLNIVDYNLAHKGNWNINRHVIQWGVGYNNTTISDKLNEWEYQDSAGYSLPFNPNVLLMNKVLKAKASLNINKYSGYLQDNLVWTRNNSTFTLQGGLRFNYNDLNSELLISPRAAASWKPSWQSDIVFKLAGGAYHQPPFYRELRRPDGSINRNLKAQKSWQGVGGADWNFIGWGRPMKLTTEAYFKWMTDVVPYDIDNVRIRYFGNNVAKAYATGVEMRLFGEIVKDAESWLSVGFMRTREDIENDFYKVYKLDSLNRPVDSSTVQGGWLRRPTDRMITFGMFFQDYLSTNKNFKVYLNTLYGSNMPYNIPNSIKYRNALTIESYIRVDIGFSALLLDTEKSNRRSRSPFRNFENIWASLEVFNLIDRQNTISYMLVKDFANNVFTMPNRLTPRLINFKIVARW